MKQAKLETLEDKAVLLLAHGVSERKVAEACGVSPSRISQLLSQDTFKERVASTRLESVTADIEADKQLDTIEAKIRDRLEAAVEYCTKPMELARIFQVVNGAQRRQREVLPLGAGFDQLVSLSLPQIALAKVTTNIHNQVIQVGEQSLVTMQSNKVGELVKAPHPEEPSHELLPILPSTLPALYDDKGAAI